MDTKRIEDLLRTRPPRERAYDRQLPALTEATRPLTVTVRVRGASRFGWPAQAFGLVLAIVVIASGSAAIGVWRSARPTGVAASATTSILGPGAFSPTGSMTTPRLASTATLLSDGRVLIVGGFHAAGGALASAELYDPASGKFSPTGSMAGPRWGQTATRLSDGRVLIAGGLDSSSRSLSSAEIYDPSTGAFRPTGSMGAARGDQVVATLLSDGRVLIAGGSGGVEPSSYVGAALATAELYDPGSGKFSSRLPFRLTISTSMSTTVFGVLYLTSRW